MYEKSLSPAIPRRWGWHVPSYVPSFLVNDCRSDVSPVNGSDLILVGQWLQMTGALLLGWPLSNSNSSSSLCF